MSDILIIKVKNNGGLGFWADSNHKDSLPESLWKVGDKVTFVDGRGVSHTDTVTTVYLGQDIHMLMGENKGRYMWHYGIGMQDDYPSTYLSEWELLEWNEDKPMIGDLFPEGAFSDLLN